MVNVAAQITSKEIPHLIRHEFFAGIDPGLIKEETQLCPLGDRRLLAVFNRHFSISASYHMRLNLMVPCAIIRGTKHPVQPRYDVFPLSRRKAAYSIISRPCFFNYRFSNNDGIVLHFSNRRICWSHRTE